MGPIFLHAHNKTSQNFYVFRPFDFQARCPSTAHLLRLGKAIEFFESCFYDIMTTQYDHPRYVKHVLAHIYVVYTLFIPYFGCVLLGIDSLRGGLAEGNRIFGQRGRFRTAREQRGHSANYCVAYPGNTPENHPPTEACIIHPKQHWGCKIQDLGPVASIRLKPKSLVYQQGL